MMKASLIDKELRNTLGISAFVMWRAGTGRFRLLHRLRRFTRYPLPDGVQCGNTIILRDDGTEMRLLVMKPPAGMETGPAILWIHGGGYALGAPEGGAARCRRMILETGAVIVSPDYTLSPEKPYPAALDDCYLTLLWLRDHAEILGSSSDRLMVAGESAGGGLAAAVTLMARDRKDVNIAFQIPLFPMLDDRDTDSSRDNHAPLWNTRSNHAAWKLYLGPLHGSHDVPCTAAPARTTDFAGLPPALTFVGDLDPFYNETVTYFRNLEQAGIPAQCRVYRGCYHGFDVVHPDASISRQAMEEFIQSFKISAATCRRPQP